VQFKIFNVQFSMLNAQLVAQLMRFIQIMNMIAERVP